MIGVVYSTGSSTQISQSTVQVAAQEPVFENLAKMAQQLLHEQRSLKQSLIGLHPITSTSMSSTKTMNRVETAKELLSKTRNFLKNNFVNLAGLIVLFSITKP